MFISSGIFLLVLDLALARNDLYHPGESSRESQAKFRAYYTLRNGCLMRCNELFDLPQIPPKNCTAETDFLRKCVCDRLLSRTKLPQCILSVCGIRAELPLFTWYVNEQLILPGHMSLYTSVGIWSACQAQRTADRQNKIYITPPDSEGLFTFANRSFESTSGTSQSYLWTPVSPNEEVSALLDTAPGDKRLSVPLRLRRYILPIWRQENFQSKLGYEPPWDIIGVEHPRSADEIIDYKSIFVVYLAAIISYAHLRHMVSQSRSYRVEALEVVLFVFLPALPAVQLINSFLRVTLGSAFGSPWSSGFSYGISGICGQFLLRHTAGQSYRLRIIDVPVSGLVQRRESYFSAQFLGRLLAIGFTLLQVMARFVAYVKRIRTPILGPHDYHPTTIYIAATGMDHRLGWIAFGGMVSTTITLVRHLVNVEWTLHPALQLPRPGPAPTSWKAELWLEIVAAAAVHTILLRLTNRVNPIDIAFRVLDFHTGWYLIGTVATVLLILVEFQRPLVGTILATRRRRRNMLKVLTVFLLLLTAVYIGILAFIQLFADVDEVADIRLGWEFGWNYLWAVPDPNWWFML